MIVKMHFMSDEYIAGVLKHSQELQAEVARLTAALAAMTAERDEHRAKREEYASEARSLRVRLSEAQGERDECRAVLDEIHTTAEECPLCKGHRTMVKHAENADGWQATTRTGPIKHDTDCRLDRARRGE